MLSILEALSLVCMAMVLVFFSVLLMAATVTAVMWAVAAVRYLWSKWRDMDGRKI